MGSLSSADRREARTVEIALAVAMGVAVVVVATVAVYLLGWTLDLAGPGWQSTRQLVTTAAAALGASLTVWWLVRARRRGL